MYKTHDAWNMNVMMSAEMKQIIQKKTNWWRMVQYSPCVYNYCAYCQHNLTMASNNNDPSQPPSPVKDPTMNGNANSSEIDDNQPTNRQQHQQQQRQQYRRETTPLTNSRASTHFLCISI